MCIRKSLYFLVMFVITSVVSTMSYAVTSQTISLNQGWNLVSFRVLPEEAIPANVFADYDPTGQDIIIAPDGKNATYYNGIWYGTLTEIMPGIVYKFYCALSNVFDVEGVPAEQIPAAETLLNSPPEGWTSPVGLQNTMLIYAQVTNLGNPIGQAPGSLLSAWQGDSIAGVTSAFTGPTGVTFALSVFSDSVSVPNMTLQLYDAATDTVYDINETFDFADGNIGTIIAPQPYTIGISAAGQDLKITDTDVDPVFARLGDNVTVTVAVQNSGEKVSEATTVDVLMSSNGGANWNIISSYNLGILAVGGSYVDSVVIPNPSLGSYLIQARVNASAEGNVVNNVGEVKTFAVIAPDLRVSSTTVNPSEVIAGDNANITVNVENIGYIVAAATTVDVFVTTDPNPEWDTLTAAASFSVASLAVAATVSDSVTVNLPTAATYYIRAKINSTAGEISLENNWGTVRTVVSSLLTYTVTFDAGAQGSISSGTAVQTVEQGGSAIAPIITPATGWTFTGWDLPYTNISSNLIVTAQYSQQTFTVTFAAGDKGSLIGNTVETVFYGGSVVAPIVMPDNFWKFTGWDLAFDNVVSDLTVTAQYVPITCVAADLNGDSIVDVIDLQMSAMSWLEQGESIVADINGSLYVDMFDYSMINECWLYREFVQQTIPLVQGWNWISFNILPEEPTLVNSLAGYSASNQDVIIAPDGKNATFYNGAWYGALTVIKPGLKYSLLSAAGGVINVEGFYVDEATQIQLFRDWNWLGYPLRDEQPIAAALARLIKTDQDVIIAPDGKNATYLNGTWYGTLTTLRPGAGYMLRVNQAQIFSYVEGVSSGEIMSAEEVYNGDNVVPEGIYQQ